MILLDIFILLLLGIVLAISANAVVKIASRFAREFRVNIFIIGFVLLGAATNLPELCVAIQAVLDKVPGLSVGNLVGGSIMLLSLVLGGSAVILNGIKLNHGMRFRDFLFSSVVLFSPVVALWDGVMTRVDAGLLILIYILHIIFINKEKHMMGNIEKNVGREHHMAKELTILFLGIVGLAISSRYMVKIAEQLIIMFHIPAFIFGLFVISIGTNLPEISLALESILQKKRDVAFGDFLGSSVIHTLLLGIVGMVMPFTIENLLGLRITLMLLTIIIGYFIYTVSSGQVVSRKEGFGLLFIYLVFCGLLLGGVI